MNLNIFKRIANLEQTQAEMQAVLLEQSAQLKQIQSRPRKPSTEKAKAYARAYYAKKKAEATKEAKEWAAKLRQDVLNAGKLMK